ncbi:hypothetical protein O3M35_010944 [Rhynocoris fuscipes]|uniref:Uncharacterized protein n=1 Tax=Rhynocoris fuscipes TaxID=488301 RepID=A0AAW1D8J2_9HEMI
MLPKFTKKLDEIYFRYSIESSKEIKLNLTDLLIKEIVNNDWSFLQELKPDEILPNQVCIEDKRNKFADYLDCLTNKLIQMIADHDINDNSLKLSYTLLYLVSHLKEATSQRLFEVLISVYIEKLEGRGKSQTNDMNKNSSGTEHAIRSNEVPSTPALYTSFLLIIEENLHYLNDINRASIIDILLILGHTLPFISNSSTKQEEMTILLIMKLYNFCCDTSNTDIWKILLTAMQLSKCSLRHYNVEKFYEVTKLFFENLKILNNFKGTSDSSMDKAIFSVALDVLDCRRAGANGKY